MPLFLVLLFFSSSSFALEFDPKWLSDPFWDSNQAEILRFDANEMHYGKPRKSTAEFILVKEDHIPGVNVKSEDPKKPGLIPRLKFNEELLMQTGVYTYRQMLSAFFDKKDLHLAKLTFSSQEWCGQTFKEFLFEPGKIHLDYNSYWEGEGKGKKDISGDAIPYNVLPVVLRALKPTETKTLEISMLSDIISNKVGNPHIVKATLNFLGRPKIGNIPVEVTWSEDGKKMKDRYEFSMDKLYPLERFERFDGAVYTLKQRIELDYWHYNHPGDEKKLK